MRNSHRSLILKGCYMPFIFTYDSYCAISHTRLVTATAVGASQGPRGLAVLKTKASLMK
jgi:hypothetical protein